MRLSFDGQDLTTVKRFWLKTAFRLVSSVSATRYSLRIARMIFQIAQRPALFKPCGTGASS